MLLPTEPSHQPDVEFSISAYPNRPTKAENLLCEENDHVIKQTAHQREHKMKLPKKHTDVIIKEMPILTGSREERGHNGKNGEGRRML